MSTLEISAVGVHVNSSTAACLSRPAVRKLTSYMRDHKIKILCRIVILVAGLVLVSAENPRPEGSRPRSRPRSEDSRPRSRPRPEDSRPRPRPRQSKLISRLVSRPRPVSRPPTLVCVCARGMRVCVCGGGGGGVRL